MEDLVVGVVTAAATAGAMAWLLRGGGAEPPVEGDALVLRYPRSIATLGWVFVAFWIGLVVVILSLDTDDPVWLQILSILGIAVFTGLPGAWFVLAHRRERLWIRPDGIEHRTLFGHRRLAWAEVERVRYGSASGWLTLIGRDGTKIRASAYLGGIGVLADLVERQFGDRGGEAAAQQLRAFRGGA